MIGTFIYIFHVQKFLVIRLKKITSKVLQSSSWLGSPEYMCYEWPWINMFSLSLSSSFLTLKRRFIARVTLLEQELVPFQFNPDFKRWTWYPIFCIVFCRPLFVIIVFVLFLLAIVLFFHSVMAADTPWISSTFSLLRNQPRKQEGLTV